MKQEVKKDSENYVMSSFIIFPLHLNALSDYVKDEISDTFATHTREETEIYSHNFNLDYRRKNQNGRPKPRWESNT
jgi:hypothetical protein